MIDADGMVVLPGLSDTHRHVWQGAVGGTGGNVSLGGSFGVVSAGLAPPYQPDDVYAGALWVHSRRSTQVSPRVITRNTPGYER